MTDHIHMKNLEITGFIFCLLTLVTLVSCSNDDAAQPPLAITSIDPSAGPKSTVITIVGTGFGSTASNNTVTLNGKTCDVISVTTTELKIAIPSKAGSGNLQVKVGNTSVESTNFEYVITATVSSLAGSTEGYADGPGVDAKFQSPNGIAVDAEGNLYVAEYLSHRIRKVSASGLVSTLAGSTQGFAEGTGSAAKFDYPRGIAVDVQGNVYVSDSQNHRIRKITPDGVVSTFAGSSNGFNDGAGSSAQFSYPEDLTFDAFGNLYVADVSNHKIRKLSPAGVVTTVAGSTQGYADGNASVAQFSSPSSIALDAVGNVYVGDAQKIIRKITTTGIVSTFAGSTQGFADGNATESKFFNPTGLVFDASSNLYVADRLNNRIRKITPSGIVTTIAGSAAYNFADGVGAAAMFRYTGDVTIDASGNLYVTDVLNYKIRKITLE